MTNLIIDHESHNKVFPEYIKTLKRLSSNYEIEVNTRFEKLVNFKKNKSYPKHSWFDYKHGYSEDLVKEIIVTRGANTGDLVLDPFCGVGTTNVVAQSLQICNIGFDISPVAVMAARAKTSFYSNKDKKDILNLLKKMTDKGIREYPPDSSLIKSSFHPKVLNSLNSIFGNISSVKNSLHRNFLMIAYLSLIENFSNRRKDGNGIKIAFSEPRMINTIEKFRSRVEKMIDDLEFNNHTNNTEIYEENFLEADLDHLKNRVNLTIFSPPYANCFDYFEVYKLEMWMGGFVKDTKDFRKYRSGALRSHVNSSFDHTIMHFNNDVDIMAKLLSFYNLWNRNIPAMVRGYFDDMTKVLIKLFAASKPDAEVHIIVANSGYKGILIPTDLLLADIATKIGFSCEKLIHARKIRSSSQQVKLLQDNYKNLMRESIIRLRKPKK